MMSEVMITEDVNTAADKINSVPMSPVEPHLPNNLGKVKVGKLKENKAKPKLKLGTLKPGMLKLGKVKLKVLKIVRTKRMSK